MPARSSLVPKYCLHRPQRDARTVRIRGKVVYIGRYGSAKSKAEYARKIARACCRVRIRRHDFYAGHDHHRLNCAQPT